MTDKIDKLINLTQNVSVWQIVDIVLLMGILFSFFLLIVKLGFPRLNFWLTLFSLMALLFALLGLEVASNVMLILLASCPLATFSLFSKEIRRELYASRRTRIETAVLKYDCSEEELIESENEIIKALQNMSKNDIGALVVICSRNIQGSIVESGTKLNAQVSTELLESIFIPKSPLHDGAVIIVGNRIIAAGCFLPLSQQTNIPKEYGTRHRAALGITEENDEVISITVSEETGIISIAENGVLKPYADTKMLTERLDDFFGITKTAKSTAVKKFWWKK